MNVDIEQSFLRLKNYCEKEGYRGWDPYDGLTSRLFQALPIISRNRICRLTWIQIFKKNPFNLRPVAGISKEFNSKGLALFLTGYCNLYKIDNDKRHLDKIHFLAEKLITEQNKNYSGSCWGYYFDWQARAFFQPANTPTVVATSFAADALMNAYDLTGEKKYLDTGLSSVDFILKDLNRTLDDEGNFCFSYSPIDHTQVYNASLLGARVLARAYFYTKKDQLKKDAFKAVNYVCKQQQPNGAWAYGTLPYHSWIDNFHTGFNLECMEEYQQYTNDISFRDCIEKGLTFYISTFFLDNGIPKYYSNKVYPIDIHAPAQLIVTLHKLKRFEEQKELANKVLKWTVKNMQDKDGFFYYQKRRIISSKIPYMRWAQAWMFYAMSYFLSHNHNN